MSRKAFNIQNKLTIIDQESIARYLQEIRIDPDTEPLTPQMEVALFSEYRLSGSTKIKMRLIKANLRWVVTIAKQFEYPKAQLGDLINEGTIGMIKAIDKFDVSLGNTFLTFATWYIRTEINQYINDVLADVVQPANRFRINKLMRKAEKQLRKDGNDTPTDEQLVAQYAKIKEKTDPVVSLALWNEVRVQSKDFVSMSTQLRAEGMEDCDLESTFRSGAEYNADSHIAKGDHKSEINGLLNSALNAREKQIVEMRFGLNGRDEKNLDQIAEIMGFTRERIGQILQGALNKLKPHKRKVYELCGSAHESAHSIDNNHLKVSVRGL